MTTCLFFTICCSKSEDGGGNNAKLPDAPQVEFKKEVIAGSRLTVISKDLSKDAKFYLDETMLKASPSAVGAELSMPFTLGKYMLYVEQNENKYDLGEILVKVNATGIPDNANKGASITIHGEGFAEDASIVLNSQDNTRLQLTTKKQDNTLTASIPDTPGTYKMSIEQANTEQILKDKFIINDKESPKVLSKFTLSSSGILKESYEFIYSSGVPSEFKVKNQTSEINFNITKDNDFYVFTDSSGKEPEFRLKIKDGKVENSVVSQIEKTWLYDNEGHLISFFTKQEKKFAWENGNIMIDENADQYMIYLYDGATESNKTAQDIAMLQAVSICFDPTVTVQIHVIYAAILGGWCGTPSNNLPTGMKAIFPPTPTTFTYSKTDDFISKMEYNNRLSVPFTYEFLYSEI